SGEEAGTKGGAPPRSAAPIASTVPAIAARTPNPPAQRASSRAAREPSPSQPRAAVVPTRAPAAITPEGTYPRCFVRESEKKATTTATHAASRRSIDGSARRVRQISRVTGTSRTLHGRVAARNTGPKNQKGRPRWNARVKNRPSVSSTNP